MVLIQLYNETLDKLELVERNLIDIFDYRNFHIPPKNFSLLRSTLRDFNKIIQDEVQGETSDTKILTLTTSTNSDRDLPNKQYKKHLSEKYNDMCFYCGCKRENTKTECDHVVPIMNMLISLKKDNNIIYNFQKVHKECNCKASNKTLEQLWERVGDPQFFPPPPNTVKSINNISIEENKEYCRGNFASILTKLSIESSDVQQHRIRLVNHEITRLKSFVQESLFILSKPDSDILAAKVLQVSKKRKFE